MATQGAVLILLLSGVLNRVCHSVSHENVEPFKGRLGHLRKGARFLDKSDRSGSLLTHQFVYAPLYLSGEHERTRNSREARQYEFIRDSEEFHSFAPKRVLEKRTYHPGEIAPFWNYDPNLQFHYRMLYNQNRNKRNKKFTYTQPNIYQAQVEEMSPSETSQYITKLEGPYNDPKAGTEEYKSDHEEPRDVPTRPKYDLPGGWAKGDLPDKKMEVGFVPLQLYSQSRKYDTVEHLPREAAEEEAKNEEELLAAPRLREVLKNKKLHEIYEEEGYEDAGYDHGGYNHKGMKVEDIKKDEEDVFKKHTRSREPIKDVDEVVGSYSSPERNDKKEIELLVGEKSDHIEERKELEKEEEKPLQNNKTSEEDLRPRQQVVDEKKELMKDEVSLQQPDEVKYMSDRMDIAESRPEQGESEARILNDPRPKVTFPGRSTRRHYTPWSPVPVQPELYMPQTPVLHIQRPHNLVNIHHLAPYVPSPYYHQSIPVAHNMQIPAVNPVHFASTVNTYASLINQNFSSPMIRRPVYSKPIQAFSVGDDYVWAPSNLHERKVKSEASRVKVKNTLSSDSASVEITTSKDEVDNIRITTEVPRKQSVRERGRRKGNTRSNTSQTQNKSVSEQSTHYNATASLNAESSDKNNTKKIPLSSGSKKMYSNFTRGSVKYNPEAERESIPTIGTFNIRHPSKPIDTNNSQEQDNKKGRQQEKIQTMHDRKKQEEIMTENTQEKAVHPHQEEASPSRKQFATDANAKYVEQLTLAHFSSPANISPQKTSSPAQGERLKELAKHLNSPQEETQEKSPQNERTRREAPAYDKEMYPHYEIPYSISKESALKYVTNQDIVPKKSYGGMEFYESKEKIRCSGPEPPKRMVPERGEDGEWNENPMPDGPRIKNLGNTIDCYKKKYFGLEPLDNPLFKEDDIVVEDNADIIRDINEKIPFRFTRSHPEKNRRIMIIEKSSVFYPNKTAFLKPIINDDGPISVDDITITTPPPYFHYSHPYTYREENVQEIKPPKHYYSYPVRDPSLLKNKRKKHMSYEQPQISVYSIISSKKIPPHHAPILLAHGVDMPKVIISRGTKDNLASDSSDKYLSYKVPKYYVVRAGEYTDNKSLIKSDSDNGIWNMMNPLKWWFPSFFDNRRDEPRYRRSAHRKIITTAEKLEMLEQGGNIMNGSNPATGAPISLSEFKLKYNISDSPKSKISRLTGGFINRNAEVSETTESYDSEATEASTRSTLPTTTVKPKVIFPRAKIPRRKAYTPKKIVNNSAESSTTEQATTTTTTTLPPPTTTRMYKPKRLLKKNSGKGSLDMFTVLKNQKEITSSSFDPPELTKEAKLLPDESKLDHDLEERKTSTESQTEVKDTDNRDSNGEQRKWKPKRKRPGRSKSVYAFRFEETTKPGKKKERDVSQVEEGSVELMKEGVRRNATSSTSTGSSSPEPPVAQEQPLTQKPSPKFILEPNKRKYFYAKV